MLVKKNRKKFLRIRVLKYSLNEFKEKYKEAKFPLKIKYVLEGRESIDPKTGEILSQDIKIKKIKDFLDFCNFIDNLTKNKIISIYLSDNDFYRVNKNFLGRLIVPASRCVR